MTTPYLIANTFSSYQLTDRQVLQGSVLTSLQLQVLQNLMATNAEEKLRLDFDVNNHDEFVQQEAYKSGWIDCIQYLIDASEAANEELNNLSTTTIED